MTNIAKVNSSRVPRMVCLQLSVLLYIGAVLVGCGGGIGNNGSEVGGSCSSAGQCTEQCVTTGDFPEGVCSTACNSDADCAGETHCIDKEGGICLLACTSPSQCREGYTCKPVDAKGTSGESVVCIGD